VQFPFFNISFIILNMSSERFNNFSFSQSLSEEDAQSDFDFDPNSNNSDKYEDEVWLRAYLGKFLISKLNFELLF
jgi:hypothetical protein